VAFVPLPADTRPPLRHDRLRGIVMRLFAITCFSAMAVLIKLGYDSGVTTPELIFYRSLFGLPPLLGWIAWCRAWGAWRTMRPGAHVLRSAIGLGSMTLAFTAISLLPLAEATIISFAAPLFALALSAPFLGEKVAPERWAAVAIGFAGVVIVAQPGGDLPLLGAAVALGAAIGVAAVTVALRSISRTEAVATTVLWFTIASLLASGLLLPWYGAWHDGGTWAKLAGIGLAGGLGQLFLTASLRYAPIAVLAPIDYLQLVYASLFGWLIWSDRPALTTLAGAGLIIASVLSTVRRRAPEGAPVAEVEMADEQPDERSI
jgi:drug/metabolite transporter (DMT)-like permease